MKSPLHNLQNVDLGKYITRPSNIPYCSGVLFYVSNKACEDLVNHMKKINYDVFYQDPETKSYPYSIEDCGVGFIMYKSKILGVLGTLMIRPKTPRYLLISSNCFKMK